MQRNNNTHVTWIADNNNTTTENCRGTHKIQLQKIVEEKLQDAMIELIKFSTTT